MPIKGIEEPDYDMDVDGVIDITDTIHISINIAENYATVVRKEDDGYVFYTDRNLAQYKNLVNDVIRAMDDEKALTNQ